MKSKYVGLLLKEFEISASSPCRIDPSGGTWDLKAFALPYESISPSTVTISLDMRLIVYLHPYKKGWIKVTDGKKLEEFPFDKMDFTSHFGLIYPIIAFFGFNGLEIEIKSNFPKYSGLGGSGVLMVATISALNEVLSRETQKALKLHEIVELSHNIEDGLRYSYTGLQDQCSAAYGGVNQWIWNYSNAAEKFLRKKLLDPKDFPELESRIVLAYLGKGHKFSDANSEQVKSFCKGKCRDKWLRIKEIADNFSQAISKNDWNSAIALMQEENDIRCSMVKTRNTELGKRLQTIALYLNCGFAVAGAGEGGCVWSLCTDEKKSMQLRTLWGEILNSTPRGKLLQCKIAVQGTKVLRRRKQL
jgi:galactokinase/mevalonate kinase-like predicted kinase